MPKLAASYKKIERTQPLKEADRPTLLQTFGQAAAVMMEPIYLIAAVVAGLVFLLLSMLLPAKRAVGSSRRKQRSFLALVFRGIGILCLFFAAGLFLVSIIK